MRKIASLIVMSVIMTLLAACQPTSIPVDFDLHGTPVVPTGITVHLEDVATPAAPAAAAATPVSAPAAPAPAAPVSVAPAAGGFRLLSEGECAPSGSHVVMKDYVRSDTAVKVYAFTTDPASTDVCRGVTTWGWRVVWVFDTHDDAVAYAAGEYVRVVAAADADPSAPGSNPATVIELWLDGVKQ